MAFKKIIMKLRRTLLCCSKRKPKSSLDIGSPTDVRRVDISDALPGLTDAERKYIREKASSDAIHLLGIQSLPPSHPATSPPSPSASYSPSLAPTSTASSREPSMALLNAASKDLPDALPTPPRRAHHENSPPAARMKSMWDSSKRLSQGSKRLSQSSKRLSTSSQRLSKHSIGHDGLYSKLEELKGSEAEEKSLNESFMTLNLDFNADDKKGLPDSPRTLSLTEGFEMQDTMGGGAPKEKEPPVAKSLVIKKAIETTGLSDNSDSEEDGFVAREQKRLVKI